MAVALANVHDDRAEPRDETWRRVRVRDEAGARAPMLVVNLSPGGLMARSEELVAIGDRLVFDLPHAGPRAAEVRWALGGRLGCRFDEAIPLALYTGTLTAMR